MIYVSTSYGTERASTDIVRELIEHGILHIELSGGPSPEKDLLAKLVDLKKEHNCHFRLHNYFPPPETDFIINLASTNEQTYQLSINHLKKAITWSEILASDRYGFHAGFLIDLTVDDLGRTVNWQNWTDIDEKKRRFHEAVRELEIFGQARGVEVYIENNVLTPENYRRFNNHSPFLLTTINEIEHYVRDGRKVLIDIAHLKVSARAQDFNLSEAVSRSLEMSDYLHISDNNGIVDSNGPVERDSPLLDCLRKGDMRGKTITLEVYSNMDAILRTRENLSKVMSEVVW